MIKKWFIFSLSVVVLASMGWARTSYKVFGGAVGFQYNGVLGTGDAGDKFSFGPGGFLEGTMNFVKSEMVLGFGYTSAKNKIKSSSTNVKFVPWYFDFRFFLNNRPNFKPFMAFGFGIFCTKFEGLKGYVQNFMISFGLGFKKRLSNNLALQMQIKPYLLTSSKKSPGLDQSFGVETTLGLAF